MKTKLEFYMDEHVSRAVIHGLRLRGVAVLTTQEAGFMGARDEEHLAFAKDTGRVIFTQDVDFLRLHAQGLPHNGIVYAPQHTSIGQIVHGLLHIYHTLPPDEMWNRVKFL